MKRPVPSLLAILSRGYFPKEMPPCFSTFDFATYANAKRKHLIGRYKGDWTKSTSYHLLRPGGARRVLSLPNPFAYHKLASTFLEQWPDVVTRCTASPLSQSVPILGTDGRAIRPVRELKELFDLRLKNRAAAGFMLKADVLDFYGSIYTHSIAWAVSGKKRAKSLVKKRRSKREKPKWSERLDQCLRCIHDGQTNGIDVGPDVSFAIAEMILSAVDVRIARSAKKLKGFRYYDDYELYFEDRRDAEHALAALEIALVEFELILNPRKTEIVALPQPLDFGWALRLRSVSRGLRDKKTQRDSLVELFEHAFQIIANGTREHVLRYVLALTQEVLLHSSNWPVYEKLLWQSSHIEPAILPTVLGEILRYRRSQDTSSSYAIDLDLATHVLNRHIVRSMRQSATHEISWAIWGLIALGRSIDDKVTKSLCQTSDSVVAVMMILAHGKGVVGRGYSTRAWAGHIEAESLKSSAWLLAYEAGARGIELGKEVPGKKWSGDSLGSLFLEMRKENVLFTDNSFGYVPEDFESDDYDYSYDEDDEDEAEHDEDESPGLSDVVV